MSTVEFITVLFFEVDEQLRAIPKHPEAHLWPSEVVTLGLLHALKGVGNRPFYRWLPRDEQLWDAMDDAANQVAQVFVNGSNFQVFTPLGYVNVSPADDLKAVLP